MRAATQSVVSQVQATVTVAVAAVLILFSSGCAERQPLHLVAKGITKITYNPRNCEQMPDGRVHCKDVIFTTALVDVSQHNK